LKPDQPSESGSPTCRAGSFDERGQVAISIVELAVERRSYCFGRAILRYSLTHWPSNRCVWRHREASRKRRACKEPAIALPRGSRNVERGLYTRRKRRNGRGGRAPRSTYLTASEFGDGLGTGGVGQRDGGMARRLQRCASDRGRFRTSSRCRCRLSRNEIFRRSSRSRSNHSATDRGRSGRLWTSGDLQARRR
jgi:hypothetical protein